MPAIFEPRCDPARAHLVDHHNIDRPGFKHVAERRDAVKILAARHRRRQCRADPRQAGVIVVRRHVLQPEQPDPGILDPLADVDRLFRPPALVDVAHQIHIGPDRLADQPRLLDLARRRGDARQTQLHLGLAVALFAQPLGGRQRLVELETAAEGAARIGRNMFAAAAEQFPEWQAQRLALDIPQRDIDRRQRHRKYPGGAGADRGSTQFRSDRLDPHRVVADGECRQLVDRMAQCPGQGAPEIGHSQSFDPGIGAEPQPHDRIDRVRVLRKAAERLVIRQCDNAGLDIGDFHRWLPPE